MSVRQGEVYFAKRLAGLICELDDAYQFHYYEEYLKSDDPRPISLTLPLQVEAYESKQLFSFFDGLIPEGWLLHVAEKNWKIDPRDRMGLLLSCCKDTIGAVSIVRCDDE